SSLPFRTGTIGGLLMVDVLHHLPKPLLFLAEAGRALQRGGRLAAIEPWISPVSYMIYPWVHHEPCRLPVHLSTPFGKDRKQPLAGSPPLPLNVAEKEPMGPLAVPPLVYGPFLRPAVSRHARFQNQQAAPSDCNQGRRDPGALGQSIGAVASRHARDVRSR